MTEPVLAYIVVITVMAWGGLSVSLVGRGPATIAIGAVLFMMSDLAVARHRFVEAAFLNRAVGLPIYYAAQLCLAFRVGTII